MYPMSLLERWIAIGLLGGAALFAGAAQAQTLKAGDTAPAFSVMSTTGKPVALADYLGKSNVVLFFYYAAFTNTWTTEIVAFELDLPKFKAANAQVLGVSVDYNAANVAFAEKLGLHFPLLSDTSRAMTRAYGVLNDDPAAINDPKRIAGYLRAKRSWFIIDKQGIIRFAQVGDPRNILPNDELLEVLGKLR